ncbi:MAG: hypothetical protein AAGA37_14265 [Actinomycetota bacterium]
MTQRHAPPIDSPTEPSSVFDPTVRLGWRLVAPSFLLIAIYAMLSVIGFFDHDAFYDSMNIPVPSNEFLLYSWAGKNTAVLLGLIIAVASRVRILLLSALAMLFTMQMGDVNAGAQSDVNVFVTWIAFALTLTQLGLVVLDNRRAS